MIENPSIKRASGLIISITGGKDLMLYEVDEAATRIRDEADPDANIIVGASFDDSLDGIVRVSVVATGIDNLDPESRAQPVETAIAQLAGRLRNDGRRIERSAPLPQAESPPLRSEAQQPVGQPARAAPEYARHAADRLLDPYGRTAAPNTPDEAILDIPAFLRRAAN
ncbi:cell division GTPase FtsZ [Bradyrhizobium sp. F1.13.1]